MRIDFDIIEQIFKPKAAKIVGIVLGTLLIATPITIKIVNITQRASRIEVIAEKSINMDSILLVKISDVDKKLVQLDGKVSEISDEVNGLRKSYSGHLETELLLHKGNQEVLKNILHQINTLNYINYRYIPKDADNLYLVKKQDN